MSLFAITMASTPLHRVSCIKQADDMKRSPSITKSGRRRFMQSGIAATGLSLGGRIWSAATWGEQPLFLAVYRPGPAWLPDKPTNEQPLREHGRYMLELYRRGLLKFAGGFDDDSGGAAAFEADDEAAARAIVDADPAVSGGVMVCKVQRWNLVDWASLASPARAAR
jgi:uncharacterized protein YciI